VRLLSPESLDESQRAIFDECARYFPEGAVCVNVVLGREAWDVRPLLLMRGSVNIMRLSPRLDEARASQLAGDIEGVGRLFNHDLKVQLIPNRGQFFIIRPFVADTLQDELEKGVVAGREQLERIVRQLIKRIGDLSRRSMAHGHLSPANVAIARGEIVLLDPLMGAIQVSSDPYLPPESSIGVSPEPTADLFCLGKMIRTLLGDSLTPRQLSVVDQLLLPSPRHRPPLAEVAVAFGFQEEGAFQAADRHPQNGSRANAGKLLRSTSGARAGSASSGISDVTRESRGNPSRANRGLLLIPLVLIGAVYAIKDRYPSLYYSLATRVPGLVSDHSVEFETEWASHQKPRMLVVARSAILRQEPAAVNAITEDILGGANPEGVRGRLLRVSLDELWRDQLSQSDIRAAVTLALIQIFPEGVRTLPPLKTLHPAIILAIAGETQAVNAGKELQSIGIDSLASLPAPFGVLFTELKKLGVSTVGNPAAIGLAAIASGDTRPQSFEGIMTAAVDEAKARAIVELVVPIVRNNPTAASELFAAIRDRGEGLGTLASWFSLEDLAGWSRIPAMPKLDVMLTSATATELDQAQYADLLKYPVGETRNFAAAMLQKNFFTQGSEKLLLTLSSDASALSREQTIALLAALKAEPATRGQFLAKWFELRPNADTVVLLLVARSSADSADIFNLEAARYLRRNTWRSPFALLELLASHPEPLARVLAYGKLNIAAPTERELLKKRLSLEKDEGCLKALMAKLSLDPKQ
jgi:hypothetical protein